MTEVRLRAIEDREKQRAAAIAGPGNEADIGAVIRLLELVESRPECAKELKKELEKVDGEG